MNKYMVITRDDKSPLKMYQTMGGARTYISKFARQAQLKMKIVAIGVEASKFPPNTEWIVK